MEAWGLEPAFASCQGNLLGSSRLKILKFHPDLPGIAHVDFQRIQTSRRWAGGIINLSRHVECAVMTWTKIAASIGQKIHKTSGMRTNDI